MKLFIWLKGLINKEEVTKKVPENESCDLDSIIAMECPVINPLYITKITNILEEISQSYSNSLRSRSMILTTGNFFGKIQNAHHEQFYYQKEMRDMIERGLKEALLDFCREHDMHDVTIDIGTDLKKMQEYDNDVIAKLYHIQGLEK